MTVKIIGLVTVAAQVNTPLTTAQLPLLDVSVTVLVPREVMVPV